MELPMICICLSCHPRWSLCHYTHKHGHPLPPSVPQLHLWSSAGLLWWFHLWTMKTRRRKCLTPCCHPFHCSTAGSSPSLPPTVMHPSLVYPDFFAMQSEAFVFCFIIHWCGWLSFHHVQEVQLTLVHPALVLIRYEARPGLILSGGPIFLARATIPFLPKPSSSKSLKCRTPPNREKRRFPLKVLSREGCESGVSSYIRVLPPWCRVMVRNATLDTTSEINHRTVAATITRMKWGHRLTVTQAKLCQICECQDLYMIIVKGVENTQKKV